MRKLYFRPQYIACCQVEDELVLLNTATGEYFSLNNAAAELYLSVGANEETACSIVTENLALTAEAASALETFLAQLCKNNLLLASVCPTADRPTALSDLAAPSYIPQGDTQAIERLCVQPPTLSSWGHIMENTLFIPPPPSGGCT